MHSSSIIHFGGEVICLEGQAKCTRIEVGLEVQVLAMSEDYLSVQHLGNEIC